MWVFPLEAFDLVGDLRRNRAVLSAVLVGLGNQQLGATVTIPPRPFQERVDRDGVAFGVGDVVVAGGYLFGAARKLAPGEGFQD
jgi:hypothetical protein